MSLLTYSLLTYSLPTRSLPTRSSETAKKNYRTLSKLLHPDKNPSAAAATVYLGVQGAYEKLRKGDSSNSPEDSKKGQTNSRGASGSGDKADGMNEKVKKMWDEWAATRSVFPLHHDELTRGHVLGLTSNTFSSIYNR
jgi:DnaJ-class molecular chaperone